MTGQRRGIPPQIAPRQILKHHISETLKTVDRQEFAELFWHEFGRDLTARFPVCVDFIENSP